MTNDELIGALRLVVHEEIGDLRLMVREEVNSAVYASEQRTNERLNKMDQRLTKIEMQQQETRGDIERLKDEVVLLNSAIMYIKDDIADLRQGIVRLETKIQYVRTEVGQIKDILNLATIEINSLQASQRAVEIKVDERCGIMVRETLKFSEYFQKTSERHTKMQNELYASLKQHIELPFRQADPRAQ